VNLKFNQTTAAGLLAAVLLGVGPVACGQEEGASEQASAAPVSTDAPAEAAGSGMSDSDQLSYALGFVMAKQAAQVIGSELTAEAFSRGLEAGQAEAPSSEDLSFAMGVMYGMDLKRTAKVTLNPEVFSEAMAASLADQPGKLSDQEIGLALTLFQQRMQMLQQQEQAAQQAQQQAAAKEALAAAAAYMEEAKQVEGHQTTDSGLVYKVVKMGDGAKPVKSDTVKVHYEGRFTDGEVFDSSYKRGAPTEFPMAGVVPGFSEGIALMPVGSEFELILPPALNYGPGGPRPNSVMIFKVELIDIVTPSAEDAVSASEAGIAPPPTE